MIQKVSRPLATIPRSKTTVFVAAFYLCVAAAAAVNAHNMMFQPDAYYYFTVARNLTEGAGLTFDGVSVTTGFHPLWLGIVTAIYFIFDSIPAFQNSIYALQTILFIAGHALLTRVALRVGISLQAILLVSVPVFIAHLNLFQFGLENTLVFFLIALLLWLHYRSRPWGMGPSVIIALVLVLTYFTRLDGIFLLVIYVPMFFLMQWRDRRFLSALALPAIVAAGVLTHWLVMFLAFGTIYSTSQMAISQILSDDPSLLRSFPAVGHAVTQRLAGILTAVTGDPSPATDVIRNYIGLVIPAGLLFSLYLVARKKIADRAPLVVVGLMAMAQLTYYAVFLNGWFQPWYFTGWYIAVAFASGFLLSPVLGRLPMMKAAAVLVVSVLAILAVDVQRSNLGWTYFAERTEKLRDYRGDGMLLVGQTPDVASFYSGVPIRHLEGLMNGYDYLRSYALRGKIASYLADIDATHFVVSNRAVLPDYVPCTWIVAKDADSGLTAYGIYDSHNTYITIYQIILAKEQPAEITAKIDKTCGPAEEV